MKVSTAKPFQIIYSVFQHEYLGFIFESFVVQLDEKGQLTFSHQNISSKNANEFASGLDEVDFELIKLMDSMQQDAVIRHFNKKNMKPAEFFFKVYDKEKGNETLQKEIEYYLERRRSKILEKISNKQLYEMGNDGEPAWRKIDIMPEKASVLFHFRRNEEDTHYFPTIKYQGEKVDFQYKGAYLICNEPAWMVVCQSLYSFEKNVDGHKLKPFLNKKFISVPRKVEDTYFRKFVAPLIASFDVYAKGFEIKTKKYEVKPVLQISELATTAAAQQISLFGNDTDTLVAEEDQGKIVFSLQFAYGNEVFKNLADKPVSVTVERQGEDYCFFRMMRDLDGENIIREQLEGMNMPLKSNKISWHKPKAFQWLNTYKEELIALGFDIKQHHHNQKRYFIGNSSITIEVKESIDWFDIHAVIRFGEFEIPFKELRNYIVGKKAEIKLPNGEIAVIPENWFVDYGELFAFLEENGHESMKLKKHHLALVQELESGELAKITMDRKLQKLRDFSSIDDHPLPNGFSGHLRPYQKAGFNWLQFLNEYNFGGCLADDMGLGKTVQTLAMLQAEKERGQTNASLLIMPTSLIYNWEKEAKKFTPTLKVFVYTGTNREKNVEQFHGYDLVLTSYGITRLDIDLLQTYYFNYIILDESQAIKNPDSNIARCVRKLNSRRRLILTGTPIENSTLDLWSQMSFVNPGLLGNERFFKDEFLTPIEKKNDELKSGKLHAIIKPFILRRHKSQVATELPEKIEKVEYSSMTSDQEELYEETKSFYRNKILEQIDQKGIGSSQLLLLQGLTKLRQIANHPKMIDPEYKGDSGKLEDVTHMMMTAVSKGHKILVFSQFVKHLSIFRDFLDQQKVSYAYLDGSTKDREKQVTLFQEDESIRIFLISLKAGGVGLNLTKADYVFLLDPWWNPAIEAQAVDRAHRIGQENKVFTYKFITRNTVEEKILGLQERKKKLAQDLISTEESFVKSLSQDDILNLLQ
jgi:superfamily II DNA or RNA helicase